MNHNSLVLNGDGQPMSIIPLSIISWQEAIKLVFLNKASVVEIYEDSRISSQKLTMAIPSVIMLNRYYKNQYVPEFNRVNLIYRDDFECQYCGNEFHPKDLTVDHVIPKSKGGKKNWDNAVISCKKCNTDKADKYLKPLKNPHQPTYFELANKRKKYQLLISNMNWEPYLSWDNNLLKMGPTRRSHLNLEEE